MKTLIAIIPIIITFFIALFAWWNVRVARSTLKQTAYQQMFSSYNLSSQATMRNPEFLYSVHKLDRNIPPKEARNISYLGLLVDCFQRFYDYTFNGDFKKMEKELVNRPTFFNNILAVPENQKRWKIMKRLFYNDKDKAFTEAVDALIENANK